MPETAHPLLTSFKEKKPAFGVWLTHGDFFHARNIASASPNVSWIAIDCEHGLVSLNPGVAELVGAIHTATPNPPTTIVRIPATGYTGPEVGSGSVNWQIKYALDAGARGVLIPMVNTAAQARLIAADARYPPQGRRGFGGAFTTGNWGHGTSRLDYFNTANESIIVLVQIETTEAVQNLKEIVSVDGIDGVFVGPSDLSIAFGFPPPSPDPDPEVEKVIQQILDTAHEAGKKCAMFCMNGKQAAKRAAQGFDMINVVSDVGALTEGIASNIALAEGRA